MSLTGCAAIPAPSRERAQMAYDTGFRSVNLVLEDIKPSDIMTMDAFQNAIVTASAIGASTNAPPHIIAIAKQLDLDWDKVCKEMTSNDYENLIKVFDKYFGSFVILER